MFKSHSWLSITTMHEGVVRVGSPASDNFKCNGLIKIFKTMNMKKILFTLLLTGFIATSFAQDDEEKSERKGLFRKDNLFTGGNVTVSFFAGGTLLGLSPFFGYSINKYVDVAASMNFNYISERDIVENGDKQRTTFIGPGAYVRLFPVNFLFAQAQYENNSIRLKYIPARNSSLVGDSYKYDVSSVLVGGGYCSGRGGIRSTYFYVSLLWDVTKNLNSPFTDNLNRAIPIVRTGFQIALFQGGGRRQRIYR
jgi:hypothetical protein